MGIRSKFKGKNTKKCILKAVLKKNATVVVKLCPKNYLFCIPTIFLPQIFDIFTQIYLPYLWHYATLAPMYTFLFLIWFISLKILIRSRIDPGQDYFIWWHLIFRGRGWKLYFGKFPQLLSTEHQLWPSIYNENGTKRTYVSSSL